MAPVNIFKYPISAPGDTAPLQYLRNWGYDASQILAVIGKTEGALSCSYTFGIMLTRQGMAVSMIFLVH
jgi:hypothetical protein